MFFLKRFNNFVKNQFNLAFKDKKLFSNFSYLTLNQLVNQILPFIYFPYVAQILGPKNYGLANYAVAIALYFSLITDFGFNFSSMRLVSIYRDDKDYLSKILFGSLMAKIFLFGICTIVFGLLIIFMSDFRNESLLFLVAYFSVLGSVFNCYYFFQGIEKIKNYFFLSFLIRACSVVLIFFFVKRREDYVEFVFINSFSNFILGAISFLITLKLNNIKPLMPSFKFTFELLKDGARYFVNAATINLYTASNAVILGFFSTKEEVGYFTAADKIRAGIQGFLVPVSSAIFPRAAYLFSRDKKKGIDLVEKLKMRLWAIMFLLCLLVFIFSSSICNLVLGSQFFKSVLPLKIIAFAPFIISISNIFGIQILLAVGRNDLFLKATLTAAIFNIIFASIFTRYYGAIASAISFLFSEIIVAFLCYFYSKKVLN